MAIDTISFDPGWIVPWITHMIFVDLKDNFVSQESHSLL